MTDRDLQSFLRRAAEHPFHRARAPADWRDLQAWPLMERQEIDDRLFSEVPSPRYVFKSGGTTGKAAYGVWAVDDLQRTAADLAHHLCANGLRTTDRVLNLMGAGDMCGAFHLADAALTRCEVTILPLGFVGVWTHMDALLRDLQPTVALGVPTVLVDTARACPGLQIERVYYGGEPMYAAQREILQQCWNVQQVLTATYASTELGVIGVRIPPCGPDEYQAPEGVRIEIADEGEIIVTTHWRLNAPFVRYRTGDCGEWTNPAQRSFRLLGRMDGRFKAWGFWISSSRLIESLRDVAATAIQVQIDPDEFVRVRYEGGQPLAEDLLDAIRFEHYLGIPGISAIWAFADFAPRLMYEAVATGSLVRNQRTGKILPILDYRQ